MKTTNSALILTLFCFTLLPAAFTEHQAEVTPDQLEFRRQAVQRMIFDRSQDIQLAGLWPAIDENIATNNTKGDKN